MPSPAPLRTVAAELDTNAVTEYELSQPLDTAAEQGDATTNSEPPPPPSACRTGDEQGLDAAVPAECHSSPSTAACTVANGGGDSWIVAIIFVWRSSYFNLRLKIPSRGPNFCGTGFPVCVLCLCFVCVSWSVFLCTFVFLSAYYISMPVE